MFTLYRDNRNYYAILREPECFYHTWTPHVEQAFEIARTTTDPEALANSTYEFLVAHTDYTAILTFSSLDIDVQESHPELFI